MGNKYKQQQLSKISPPKKGLNISQQELFDSLKKLDLGIGEKITSLLKPITEQFEEMKDSLKYLRQQKQRWS